MSTIKERAKEYSHRNGTEFLSGFENAEREAYIKGATEQRLVDIEKIVEYAENFNKQNEEFGIDARLDVESTRKWATNILLGDDFDEYLMSKIKQATPIWKDVDVDEYMSQFRDLDN